MGKKQGYSELAVAWDFTKHLNAEIDFKRLSELEMELDLLQLSLRVKLICQYDKETAPAARLMEVLNRHPRICFRHQVYDNYSYIPGAKKLSDSSREEAGLDRYLQNLEDRKSVV